MIDLETIQARCDAATPGPWKVVHRDVRYTGEDDESLAGLGLDVDGPPTPMLRGMFQRGADAQFIAHAREDIPALIAEYTRIREALEILAKMEGYSLDCLALDAGPRVAIR